MELGGLTSTEEQEEDGVQTALRDKLSTIYLGAVIDIWQDQRQVCVGSHAEFAKHLLDVHKEYCLDYCCAESQERAAVLSLCVDHQRTTQEKNGQLFQSMKSSHEDGQNQPAGFGKRLPEVVPENLLNVKQSTIKLPHADDQPQPSSFGQCLAEVVSDNLQYESDSDDDTIIDQDWEDGDSDYNPRQEEVKKQLMDVTQEADELDVKPRVCTACGETFSEMSTLESHMKSHEAENTDVCSEGFKELSTSIQPVLPVGDKSFVCMICDLMFPKLSGFQAHMRTHTEEQQDLSSNSAKGFRETFKYTTTTVTDKEKKPLVGSSNNLRTSQLENLNARTKTHTIAMSSIVTVDTSEIKDKEYEGVRTLHSKSTKTIRAGANNQLKQIKSSVGQLKTQNTTLINKKPHMCSDCGKGFNHLSSLKTHMRSHTGEKPYVCPECGRGFSQSGGLKGHMYTHNAEKPHVCSDCGKGVNDMSSLRIHMMEHTGEKPHVCSVCGRGFSVMSRLKAHMMTHTGEKPHLCSMCGKGFSQPNQLKVHMRGHTGEKPHMCTDCGRGFSLFSRLKAHKMTHTGEKPHLCSMCGKGFSLPSQLKSHMMCHTGEKPHVCTDCGRGFSQTGTLKTHMKTHTGERPHVCELCGLRCSALGNLKKHLMIHSGEKPHVCQECGKAFTHANKLRQHMRIHTGEKPHLCPYCGMGFSQFENLKAHIITHTGDTPYVCTDCGKGFSTNQSYKRHLMIHTGEKPFVCPECGKGFNQPYNLKTHMKTHT